jgi:hypothetical protein
MVVVPLVVVTLIMSQRILLAAGTVAAAVAWAFMGTLRAPTEVANKKTRQRKRNAVIDLVFILSLHRLSKADLSSRYRSTAAF